MYIPTHDVNDVTESGKPAKRTDGVKYIRMEDGAAVYEVGSGNYTFVLKM